MTADWRGRVIDAHGHLGPWHNFLIPDPTPVSLIETMDRCGVRRIGVSHLLALGPDSTRGNALAREAVQAHPERLFGYAVFNPHHRQAAAEVEDLLAEPGFAGVKIHPDTHEHPLAGPGYEQAFELAARAETFVLSHSQHGSPWSGLEQFAEVAARHPEVPLLVGHSGLWPAGFPEALAIASEHPSLHLELCGSRMTRHWVARFVTALGASRVLFGSDAVFLDLRVGLGRVVHADITDEERADVLYRNMGRLLGEATS